MLERHRFLTFQPYVQRPAWLHVCVPPCCRLAHDDLSLAVLAAGAPNVDNLLPRPFLRSAVSSDRGSLLLVATANQPAPLAKPSQMHQTARNNNCQSSHENVASLSCGARRHVFAATILDESGSMRQTWHMNPCSGDANWKAFSYLLSEHVKTLQVVCSGTSSHHWSVALFDRVSLLSGFFCFSFFRVSFCVAPFFSFVPVPCPSSCCSGAVMSLPCPSVLSAFLRATVA